MSIIAKIVIALAIIAAAVAVVMAYNNAIAKAAKLEKELERISAERDGWIAVAAEQEAAKHAVDKLLAARERQRNKLEQERNKAYAEINELRARPDVKPWSDTPIPQPVLDRLRDGGKPPATPDDKGSTPKRVDGGDTTTNVYWLSYGGPSTIH